MENCNNINWKEECEGFTSVYPEKTNLAVKLMLDDCNSAANFGHPVIVFMQNSYDTEDFYTKVAITADEKPENISNTEIKIKDCDYEEVIEWVSRHRNLIHRLSRMEIDIFWFSEELKNENPKSLWKKCSDITNSTDFCCETSENGNGETIYAIIDSKTHENVFPDNRTFAAIIPIAHKDDKGTYVLVYPKERESEYTLEKQYLPEK